VEVLLRFHQRRLPQERKRFLRWWQHWQRPDVRTAWQYLAGDSIESSSAVTP
jgi:hypothetical protein